MKKTLFDRQTGARSTNPTYLIFCEGETEKVYFQSLKKNYSSSITIKCNKLSNSGFKKIAEEIGNTIDRLEGRGMSFDFIYCVYDNNNCSVEDYKIGKKTMKDKGVELIYSNKSFEVWILMHFIPFNKSGLSPTEYKKELLGFGIKEDKPYPGLYSKISGFINNAVKNSKTINEIQLKDNKNEEYKCDPYTDIYKIIESLNKNFNK